MLAQSHELTRSNVLRVQGKFNEAFNGQPDGEWFPNLILNVALDVFDLKDCQGKVYKILNIVDLGTRFQVCVRLKKLSSRHIFKLFNRHWVSWAGPPLRVTVDQGHEFLGNFFDSCERMGMDVNAIPTDAPWQNGVCERRGGVFKIAAYKVIEHEQVYGSRGMDFMLSMITAARNQLINATGFSPAQWVLGISPRVPASLLHGGSNPAVNSEATENLNFGKRLAIQAAARAAMVEVDSSDRLRRALLRKSRPDRAPFEAGEQVYFYRRRAPGKKTKGLMSARWVGPGIVLGQEGRSAVWISHRSTVVKIAPEMVRRASAEEQSTWSALLADAESLRNLMSGDFRYEQIPFDDPGPFADFEPVDEAAVSTDSELPYYRDDEDFQNPDSHEGQDIRGRNIPENSSEQDEDMEVPPEWPGEPPEIGGDIDPEDVDIEDYGNPAPRTPPGPPPDDDGPPNPASQTPPGKRR